MKLKPYPVYKDSGVPWLGEVPAHWEVRKLKHAVSFSGGGTPSKADASFWNGYIPWVSPKDMQRPRITDATDHITDEAVLASTTNLVPPGAVLLVVRSGILRRAIPVAINEVEVALNQDMKALRPRRGLMAEYLCASVQGNESKLITEWTKQGATVESIEHQLLANSHIPLPPLPEQSAIVHFLDYMDRRIRRYIRAKQTLIKLLEEQKQAIIHRAVTRGLDPNVRLKPSGVEWLGQVPEHWQIAKLVRLTTRIGDGLHGTPAYVDESEYHFINGNNLSSGAVKITKSTRCVNEVEFQKHQIALDDSTLLMSINGTIGNVAFYRGESLVLGKSAAYINCDKSLARSFLFFFLQSSVAKEFFQLELTGTTIFNLSLASIRNLSVALPPLPEQIVISSFLEVKIAEFDDLINRAQSGIALLREYRTRLIADVVTGKLDVREVAARLPDEIEELELLDEAETLSDADEDAADDLDPASEEDEP